MKRIKNKIVYAGIVTFNPELNLLNKNIKAIESQVKKVILVDNGSKNKKEIEQIINKKENCVMIYNKINKGIAFALNCIMELAQKEGASWVLLLDQDSISPCNIIKEFLKYTNVKNVAVITPVIKDVNDNKIINYKSKITSIVQFITSGSFNNVSIWNELGRFNEKLFIDMVDYDYAYRVNKAGYIALRINSIFLRHAIGKQSYHYVFFLRISTYNHNAFRKYYITRNSIYLAKMYPCYCNIFTTYLKIFKRFLLVVFFEDDKLNKIKSMLKGIKDSRLVIGGK